MTRRLLWLVGGKKIGVIVEDASNNADNAGSIATSFGDAIGVFGEVTQLVQDRSSNTGDIDKFFNSTGEDIACIINGVLWYSEAEPKKKEKSKKRRLHGTWNV